MTDRELLAGLFVAALAAVDPLRALPPHLWQVRELYRAGGYRRLPVAGFGKAGVPMALAAEQVLGEELTGGLVIVPHGTASASLPQLVEAACAGHPHPDAAGVAAARRIMELARLADEETLLLLLVSGGGSALLSAPAPGITLEEKLRTSALLMSAGADIGQLNTVRKHLSRIKGGRLAALARPARIFALLISDVPGDRPDVIASGPAVPDPTTFADALAVLEGLKLAEKVPAAITARLRQGIAGVLADTPKPGDASFAAVTTVIAAGNRNALEAAALAAHARGLQTCLVEEQVLGEAREAGKRWAELALGHRKKLRRGERICLLSGGETTVRVTGKGKGGRNQELALAFALAIEGVPGIGLLSAGTDGIDGPTDAAGAVVDGGTLAAARAAGLDPAASLANNDAYPLLDRCGALLRTGATGTNVMDLQLALITG